MSILGSLGDSRTLHYLPLAQVPERRMKIFLEDSEYLIYVLQFTHIRKSYTLHLSPRIDCESRINLFFGLDQVREECPGLS